MATAYDGASIAATSIRLWGIAGAVFRHQQAVRSWESPRGRYELRTMAGFPGWIDGLRDNQRAENDALLAAVFAGVEGVRA
jgi:hypothetical protein